MDDVLLRQLVRQLRIINFWIMAFGTLVVVSLLVMGYMLFKVVTFVHQTNQKIETIQQQAKDSLDVKAKVCGTDSVGGFLADKTSLCSGM